MRPIRLAYRYAKALFELAGEQDIREQVFNDMKLLSQTCAASRELKVMLQSPVIRYDKKNKVIHELFGKYFHPTVLAYSDIIFRKRREMLLPEIAVQYVVLYKEWKGIRTARFVTASEVDEKMKLKVMTLLKTQMKSEIELETQVRPELIGGFLLSVDDKQLDSTILSKINKLTREFKVNVYQKKV